MKSSALVFASLSLVAATHLTGCSSGDASGGGGAGGAGSAESSVDVGPGPAGATNGATTGATTGPTGTTGATTGGGTTTGTTSSTGGGDDCAAMATAEACYDCECTKNEAGCTAYDQFEADKCFCGTGAPCATACAASICTDADPDTACETCLDGLDETCFDDAATQCEADAACNAFLMASSACDALPDM